jgi:hypothetical protein
MGLIANWALVMVILHIADGDVFPTWEGLGVFETQQACFAALEREQLAHDRIFSKYPETVKGSYYRCEAPAGNSR